MPLNQIVFKSLVDISIIKDNGIEVNNAEEEYNLLILGYSKDILKMENLMEILELLEIMEFNLLEHTKMEKLNKVNKFFPIIKDL